MLQSYELRGKQPFVSDFSRLLRHAIEKGRGPILYSKKNPGPHGDKKPLVFTCLQYESFENTMGKTEIACNEQFLIFPQCFLP